MKPNELRVGNKLQKDNGDIFTVLRIDNTQDVLVEEQRGLLTLGYNLFGIPLSEEWLLRARFYKKYDSGKGNGKGCYSKKWVNITLSENGFYTFSEHGDHTSITYHYVHQLQNLYFALTGEELTFKDLDQ